MFWSADTEFDKSFNTQVFPAEIRNGCAKLSYSQCRHVVLAAYATLQAVVGRRHPTLAHLKWGDVSIVKTAAMQTDGQLVHVFGVVMRFLVEKVDDVHGTRIAVLDPTGDSNYIDEQYLVSGTS